MHKTDYKKSKIRFKKAAIFIAFQLLFNQLLFSQWNLIPTGTSQFLYGDYFLNNDTGFVFGDYVILKTTDGGMSWSSPSVQILSQFAAMTFVNNAIGFLVGDGGAILKTVDGGDTWFAQNSPVTELLYSLYFTDSLHGIIVGDEAIILKTSDGGNNWIQIQSPYLFGDSLFYYELRTVQFISDSVGFAAGGPYLSQTGIIIKTSDAGDSWNTIFQSQDFPVFLQMEFVNDSIAYASGSCYFNNPACYRSKILKTTNQGSSWNEIYSIWADELRSIDVVGSNIYSVGYNPPSIIFSNDSGNSWVNQNPLTMTFPYQVFFTDSLTGYIVGDSGKVLKTVNGGVGWQEIVNSTPVLIYPNPTNDNVFIQSDDFDDDDCQVSLYNTFGQLIKKMKVIKGSKEVEISLKEYPDGIYFIQVENGRDIITRKVVKY